MIDYVRSMAETMQDGQNYVVLLIITDGGISGIFFKKLNFKGLISTKFEFSRHAVKQFLTKIEISASQIWLKAKFCQFKIVENPPF